MKWWIKPRFSVLGCAVIIVWGAWSPRAWWSWPLAFAVGFAYGTFENRMERKLRRENRW